jgi:hypothetical protein
MLPLQELCNGVHGLQGRDETTNKTTENVEIQLAAGTRETLAEITPIQETSGYKGLHKNEAGTRETLTEVNPIQETRSYVQGLHEGRWTTGLPTEHEENQPQALILLNQLPFGLVFDTLSWMISCGKRCGN